MAQVVSLTAVRQMLSDLGWTSVSLADVVAGLPAAGIAAVELVAYLQALKAAPDGVDDQAIIGCPPTDAAKITNYLRSKGAVIV